MHQETLLSAATDTGGTGEYGRHCPFLNDGLQEWVLVGEDGTRVPTVYHFYSG